MLIYYDAYLATHIGYPYNRYQDGGIGFAESHLDRVVRQVDVGDVVPGVKEEIADGE